mmetsp:Transcript_18758/g.46894  ORF Transcript_18758/g.46894 Transcript_18758/m.46894 type:complete len:237 (-) Transcript_18758:3349-4059(-)
MRRRAVVRRGITRWLKPYPLARGRHVVTWAVLLAMDHFAWMPGLAIHHHGVQLLLLCLFRVLFRPTRTTCAALLLVSSSSPGLVPHFERVVQRDDRTFGLAFRIHNPRRAEFALRAVQRRLRGVGPAGACPAVHPHAAAWRPVRSSLVEVARGRRRDVHMMAGHPHGVLRSGSRNRHEQTLRKRIGERLSRYVVRGRDLRGLLHFGGLGGCAVGIHRCDGALVHFLALCAVHRLLL